MHRMRITTTLFAATSLLASSAHPAQGQATTADSSALRRSATEEMRRDFAPVAANLVGATKLGPGKRVNIHGGSHMLPLMEELAIAVERSGANALLVVTTDSLERVGLTLPRAQRLSHAAISAARLNGADLNVTFPFVGDYRLYAGQSPESQQISTQADSLFRARRRMSESRGRELFVAVPMSADTANSTLSYADLARTRWNAMAADYRAIAATGAAIQRQLSTARKIRLTSPEGTDITFSLVKGRISVDAGPLTAQAVLDRGVGLKIPGGYLHAIVDPTSATGALRSPVDWCDLRVENEAIDVDHGKPTTITASRDEECIRKTLSPLRAGLLTIGLNASNELAATAGVISFPDLYSAGMVSFGFGFNIYAGGSDKGPGQWLIALPRATVYADGVAIVRDGRIVTGQLQARNK